MPGTVTTYEFMGNTILFWILCLLGITLPLAILYLLGNLARVEVQMENPMGYVLQHKGGGRHGDQPTGR